jgi:hypothetical protein
MLRKRELKTSRSRGSREKPECARRKKMTLSKRRSIRTTSWLSLKLSEESLPNCRRMTKTEMHNGRRKMKQMRLEQESCSKKMRRTKATGSRDWHSSQSSRKSCRRQPRSSEKDT